MSDNYAKAITIQAVAHICLALGFEKGSKAALEAITDVVARFVEIIGEYAKDRAESTGRTKINLVDIIGAFQQMELKAFAFRDTIDPSNPDSHLWYQPFHTAVPNFPIKKRPRNIYGDGDFQTQDKNRPAYIPDHLPPLPPVHTYRKTKRKNVERNQDLKRIREQKLKREHMVQKSLDKISRNVEDDKEEKDSGKVQLPKSFGVVEQSSSDTGKKKSAIPPLKKDLAQLSKEERILEGVFVEKAEQA